MRLAHLRPALTADAPVDFDMEMEEVVDEVFAEEAEEVRGKDEG